MVATKSGVSDILACDPLGRFWAFEVKTGTKPSPLQLWNIDEIRKRNGQAHVVYSLDDVKAAIRAYSEQSSP